MPPPIPAVTNTMSAPSKTCTILSLSSFADFSPISGFPPAPKPLVTFFPNTIFIGAREIFNACSSVLIAIKSIPVIPFSIILFTALQPQPPTPTTLIIAGDVFEFSISIILISPLGCFIHSPTMEAYILSVIQFFNFFKIFF